MIENFIWNILVLIKGRVPLLFIRSSSFYSLKMLVRRRPYVPEMKKRKFEKIFWFCQK